jgi:hypothetical protein
MIGNVTDGHVAQHFPNIGSTVNTELCARNRNCLVIGFTRAEQCRPRFIIILFATAAIAHRVCVCCCRQLYCCRSKIIVISSSSSSSSSIGMQSSAVHGRAVARNSFYCKAPTLRSNATTSGLFMAMANLRGVLPPLQAGG